MEFSASHRLWRDDWDSARNRSVFGRSAGEFSHGHNYELEVTVDGPVDEETGMVIDLKDLQEVLEREVMVRFDHRDLNRDTPFFEKEPPTPENFVRVIQRLLVAALPGGLLDRIRLQEDPDTWVEWVDERGSP